MITGHGVLNLGCTQSPLASFYQHMERSGKNGNMPSKNTRKDKVGEFSFDWAIQQHRAFLIIANESFYRSMLAVACVSGHGSKRHRRGSKSLCLDNLLTQWLPQFRQLIISERTIVVLLNVSYSSYYIWS